MESLGWSTSGVYKFTSRGAGLRRTMNESFCGMGFLGGTGGGSSSGGSPFDSNCDVPSKSFSHSSKMYRDSLLNSPPDRDRFDTPGWTWLSAGSDPDTPCWQLFQGGLGTRLGKEGSLLDGEDLLVSGGGVLAGPLSCRWRARASYSICSASARTSSLWLRPRDSRQPHRCSRSFCVCAADIFL